MVTKYQYLQAYMNECFSTQPLRWKERPAKHFLTEAQRDAFNRRYANQLIGSTVALNKHKYKPTEILWILATGTKPPRNHATATPVTQSITSGIDTSISPNQYLMYDRAKKRLVYRATGRPCCQEINDRFLHDLMGE